MEEQREAYTRWYEEEGTDGEMVLFDEVWYRAIGEQLSLYFDFDSEITKEITGEDLKIMMRETLEHQRIFYQAFEITIPAGGSINVQLVCITFFFVFE